MKMKELLKSLVGKEVSWKSTTDSSASIIFVGLDRSFIDKHSPSYGTPCLIKAVSDDSLSLKELGEDENWEWEIIQSIKYISSIFIKK